MMSFGINAVFVLTAFGVLIWLSASTTSEIFNRAPANDKRMTQNAMLIAVPLLSVLAVIAAFPHVPDFSEPGDGGVGGGRTLAAYLALFLLLPVAIWFTIAIIARIFITSSSDENDQ